MKEIREGKKAKDRKLIGRKESWGVGSVGGMECGGDGRRWEERGSIEVWY